LGCGGEDVDLVKYLQAQENVYLLSATALNLRCDARKGSFTWHDNNGTWLITPAYQKQIVGLLDGVLEANDEGHQYLDAGASPVQIMVARDEYPLPSLDSA
jgi:hypothetical protein